MHFWTTCSCMKFIQLLSCLSQDIQRLVINLLLLMIILGYASAPITQITIIGEGYIKLQAQECVFNAVITCFLRDFFFPFFFSLFLSRVPIILESFHYTIIWMKCLSRSQCSYFLCSSIAVFYIPAG